MAALSCATAAVFSSIFALVSFKSCAGIFLLQRCHRIGVILFLLQVVFALQNIQFVRIIREFLIRVREFLSPVGFILDRRFLFGGRGRCVLSSAAGFLAWSSAEQALRLRRSRCQSACRDCRCRSSSWLWGPFFFSACALRAASATLPWSS